jgi:hypothetical protein
MERTFVGGGSLHQARAPLKGEIKAGAGKPLSDHLPASYCGSDAGMVASVPERYARIDQLMQAAGGSGALPSKRTGEWPRSSETDCNSLSCSIPTGGSQKLGQKWMRMTLVPVRSRQTVADDDSVRIMS